MCKVMRMFGLGFCIFIMAAFFGCVAPGSNIDTGNTQAPSVAPWPGDVYSPKLPVGIETLDAAKRDLAELLKSRKNPGIKYYGQQGINNYAEQEALKALLKGKGGTITFWYDSSELLFMAFESTAALDDRIVVSPRIAFFYTDLIDNNIVARKTAEWPAWGNHIVGHNIEGLSRPYKIHFPGLMSFLFENPADAQRFADDLFFIQQTLKKQHEERRAFFESKAVEYRSLTIKPQVSEEQRKYIVQANALSQEKMYDGAIGLYLKAIDLDLVSYPEAYFNLALLYAQERRFNMAISSMKQYLLLEPEAKDARSAQDKIYEWELKIQK